LHAAANEAARSARRFHISAAAIAHASAHARAQGLEVIGFYHSHPRGIAEPSAEDLRDASAWPGYLHLIAAPNDTPTLRAYRTDSPRWHEQTIL
jgi:proteasome lid subunit RPN8/RPN11